MSADVSGSSRHGNLHENPFPEPFIGVRSQPHVRTLCCSTAATTRRTSVSLTRTGTGSQCGQLRRDPSSGALVAKCVVDGLAERQRAALPTGCLEFALAERFAGMLFASAVVVYQ